MITIFNRSFLHLSLNFPLKKGIDIIKYQVFVIFNHGVSLSNAEVNTSRIDEFLILNLLFTE